MSLRYCFEESYVKATLSRSKSKDLAVIDTDGISTSVIKAAVERGVFVYGYINAAALENGRSYYTGLKHLRLAKYEGWSGEYWIDPTAQEWKKHIVNLAKTIKATGAIGVYLDNTDLYGYIRDKEIKKQYSRNLPSASSVYKALSDIILELDKIGLIVMPNGGDIFARKFITEHPGVIATVNQEGLLYEDFKKQSSSETAYRKNWCKWAQKHISGKVRIIDYTKNPIEIAKVKTYCAAHGWDCYISKHTDLRGD